MFGKLVAKEKEGTGYSIFNIPKNKQIESCTIYNKNNQENYIKANDKVNVVITETDSIDINIDSTISATICRSDMKISVAKNISKNRNKEIFSDKEIEVSNKF